MHGRIRPYCTAGLIEAEAGDPAFTIAHLEQFLALAPSDDPTRADDEALLTQVGG